MGREVDQHEPHSHPVHGPHPKHELHRGHPRGDARERPKRLLSPACPQHQQQRREQEIEVLLDRQGPRVIPEAGQVVLHEQQLRSHQPQPGRGAGPRPEGDRHQDEDPERRVDLEPAADQEAAHLELTVAQLGAEEQPGDQVPAQHEEQVHADPARLVPVSQEAPHRGVGRSAVEMAPQHQEDRHQPQDVERRNPARPLSSCPGGRGPGCWRRLEYRGQGWAGGGRNGVRLPPRSGHATSCRIGRLRQPPVRRDPSARSTITCRRAFPCARARRAYLPDPRVRPLSRDRLGAEPHLRLRHPSGVTASREASQKDPTHPNTSSPDPATKPARSRPEPPDPSADASPPVRFLPTPHPLPPDTAAGTIAPPS